MAVPWLTVGSLVLANLDKIMAVVRPAFTRRQIETLDTQAELLNQQIAELQSAASSNSEQVKQLAAQLKDLVTALDRAAIVAANDYARSRRLSWVALGVSGVAIAVVIGMWVWG